MGFKHFQSLFVEEEQIQGQFVTRLSLRVKAGSDFNPIPPAVTCPPPQSKTSTSRLIWGRDAEQFPQVLP